MALGVRRLKLMALRICEFHENRRMAGENHLMGANEITFTRVHWNLVVFKNERTKEDLGNLYCVTEFTVCSLVFFFFSLLSALVLVVTWCKVLSSESYCQDLAWRRTPLSCRKDLMVWFWWNYSIVNTVIGFVLFWEVSCSLHITYEVHRFPRLQKACDLDNQACLRRL